MSLLTPCTKLAACSSACRVKGARLRSPTPYVCYRFSSPRLTLASSAANTSGLTARCPRSGDLLSRIAATRPAAVVPTSTHDPPLLLMVALRHSTTSVLSMPLPPFVWFRARRHVEGLPRVDVRKLASP